MARWASFLEVSRSSYYAWLREREERRDRYQAYADWVVKVFQQSGGTYGMDRVAGQLRENGHPVSFRKVKRIMNEHGPFSVHSRYQRSLTDSRDARDGECPNLLRTFMTSVLSRRCLVTSPISRQEKDSPMPAR